MLNLFSRSIGLLLLLAPCVQADDLGILKESLKTAGQQLKAGKVLESSEIVEKSTKSLVDLVASAPAKDLAELKKLHIKADGEQGNYTRLEAHLRRYAARNTFDYFIHKDLGGFLRRELDFYIKNEVMHLDIEDLSVEPKIFLSTSSELLLRLRWMAVLHGKTPLSLALSGGVHKVHDAIKGIMAGADVLQTVSLILRHGPHALEALIFVRIRAGGQGVRLLLLAGKPIGEPVVQYGPFVMNTPEEIQQALRDYQSGKLAVAG